MYRGLYYRSKPNFKLCCFPNGLTAFDFPLNSYWAQDIVQGNFSKVCLKGILSFAYVSLFVCV